jgi:hypothetical protein
MMQILTFVSQHSKHYKNYTLECIITHLTISGFLNFVNHPVFQIARKLDLFPSLCEGMETPTLLGPIERANLNHWTTHVI